MPPVPAHEAGGAAGLAGELSARHPADHGDHSQPTEPPALPRHLLPDWDGASPGPHLSRRRRADVGSRGHLPVLHPSPHVFGSPSALLPQPLPGSERWRVQVRLLPHHPASHSAPQLYQVHLRRYRRRRCRCCRRCCCCIWSEHGSDALPASCAQHGRWVRVQRTADRRCCRQQGFSLRFHVFLLHGQTVRAPPFSVQGQELRLHRGVSVLGATVKTRASITRDITIGHHRRGTISHSKQRLQACPLSRLCHSWLHQRQT